MTLNRSTSHLETPVDVASLDAQLSEVRRLIFDLSQQLVQQQEQFNALSGGFSDIVEVLKQLQKDSPTPEIEAINQNLEILGKAMVNTFKKIDRVDINKDLSKLQAEQQTLRKASESTQKNLKDQSDLLANHLDWKRAAIIIVITAIISSLSSLAIAYLVVSNQSSQKDQNSAQTEKPLNQKSKKATQQKK
jgi:small-conductance mechanosensitive channel